MAEVEIGIGKSGRRAYGFDDVAIVPSRRTRDPEDVSITWEIDAFRFELPLLASAMDGVVSPRTAIEIGRLGGLGVLNLEGLWTRYDDPDPSSRRSRSSTTRRPPSGCRSCTPSRSRPSSSASASSRSRTRGSPPRASLTPQRVQQYSQRVLDAGRRPVRHPGHRRQRRARLEPRRAAEPEAVHRRPRRAGDRRWVRLVLHRAAPHAHRRGRPARGRRPGPRVHHPRRARRRRADGDRDRGRRRRPDALPRRDGRPLRAHHRRRRHAYRRRHRQGDRLRRRRGHDRLAARRAPSRRRAAATTGGWRPSIPTCPAAPGCKTTTAGTLKEILVGPAHDQRRHA